MIDALRIGWQAIKRQLKGFTKGRSLTFKAPKISGPVEQRQERLFPCGYTLHSSNLNSSSHYLFVETFCHRGIPICSSPSHYWLGHQGAGKKTDKWGLGGILRRISRVLSRQLSRPTFYAFHLPAPPSHSHVYCILDKCFKLEILQLANAMQ